MLTKSILKFDLRPFLPPVRDQGVRGTCLAFALTCCHEVEIAGGSKVDLHLGEEVLFWGARQLMPPSSGDGINAIAASNALKKWGQSEAHHWPYDDKRSHLSKGYHPPSNAIDHANCRKADMAIIPVSVDEILKYLRDNRPVVLSINLSKQFFTAKGGKIDIPSAAQMINSRHAILLVGYQGSDTNASDSFFVFRNSWGEDWGDSGYGFLPQKYVTQFGLRACVVSPL